MRPDGLRRRELTRLVTVRLLDTAGGGGSLASSLGSELLTGSLATSGLTCREKFWLVVGCLGLFA